MHSDLPRSTGFLIRRSLPGFSVPSYAPPHYVPLVWSDFGEGTIKLLKIPVNTDND